jgi:uncharacterized protein YdeI (YjbR/CyaY-like superfamily)
VSEPVFFSTPDDFRAWLEEHHGDARELIVGFYKKGSGRASMTWSESVDQALCFGWIDGVRRRIDDDSYTIRFTPRKPRSTWSAVNVAKVAQLEARGLMTPAGRRAFEQRAEHRTGTYSYERRDEAQLPEDYEQRFRSNAAAWEFFQSQPPSYRRTAIHLVVSAKQHTTRERRLEQLIADSAAGRRIKQLSWPRAGGAAAR